MKRFKLYPIATLLIGAFLFSCSPEYIPNMANTPMLDNKGEIQANVAAALSGTEIQAAYALTDNLGIMANSSFLSTTSDTTDDFHKHSIFEFGVGYFDDFSDIGRYEIYGGFGTGKVKAYNEDLVFDEDITDAKFSKIFLQPSFGLKSDYFDGNLGARLALVKVNYQENTSESDESFHPFIEPVVTVRAGIKNFKLVSQLGYSLPVGGEYVFDTQPFIFSIGLHMRLNTQQVSKD